MRKVRNSRLRPLFRTGTRARMHLAARLNRTPATAPLFVLASPRTGSTLLADRLSQHPSVWVAGEALNHRTDHGVAGITDPQRIEAHLRAFLATRREPVPGTKIFHSHLERAGWGIDDLYRLYPELHAVLLYRASLPEQFVSWAQARRIGQWQLRPGHTRRELPAQTVNPDRFREFRGLERRRVEQTYEVLARRGEVSVVCYEDLAADPQPVLDRLWGGLGLDPVPLGDTALQRQRTYRHLSEKLANYDEVADLFDEAGSHLDLLR